MPGLIRVLSVAVVAAGLLSTTADARAPRPNPNPHRYDLAEFGLDPGQIRERFAAYIERYGVELEA